MKILLLILLHLCNRNIRMEQQRGAALKLDSCTFPSAHSEAAHSGGKPYVVLLPQPRKQDFQIPVTLTGSLRVKS